MCDSELDLTVIKDVTEITGQNRVECEEKMEVLQEYKFPAFDGYILATSKNALIFREQRIFEGKGDQVGNLLSNGSGKKGSLYYRLDFA